MVRLEHRLTFLASSFLALSLIFSGDCLASTNPATGSAVVSASVIGTTFSGPEILAPTEGSTTRNLRETLVWKRPDVPKGIVLDHYEIYLDGNLFASSVSDSLTSETYYFYRLRRQGDTFYLDPNTNFTQGYHTWQVFAYNTAGISSSSSIRTYYVDSIFPFISLEKVNRLTLNWDTSNPSSIPDVSQREINTQGPNPLLSGRVEPYANMQIVLLCPQNILIFCRDQVWQGNYPSGVWQHRFYGLVRGLVYTVHISATDAGSNSTIFPEFYLGYDIIGAPLGTITPTISPAPPEVVDVPVIEPIPTPFIPAPPTAPTPPPPQTEITAAPATPFPWLLFLLVLGLPLHLAVTLYGTKTAIGRLPRFLWVLYLSIFARNKYQTAPFSTLIFYDSEKLDRVWQTKIANVSGFYDLPPSQPSKLFVKISCTGRKQTNSIIESSQMPSSCLLAVKDDIDHYRSLFLKLRALPLTLACITSFLALVIQPNYFYLVYLYLSTHLVYTEYLYPHQK